MASTAPPHPLPAVSPDPTIPTAPPVHPVQSPHPHRPLQPLRPFAAFQRSAGLLPRGGTLDPAAWQRRHRAILALLWFHALLLLPIGLLTGHALGHTALEVAAVAAIAAMASVSHLRVPRVLRAAFASIGLLASSGLLVHFSGGYIELHFHFFVMLAVITLYQDWVPLLISIAFVVVHHGTIGVLDPTSVYNHPAAWSEPWMWAGIHGAFILAACAASVAHWRFTEAAQDATRAADRRAYEDLAAAESRVRAALADVSAREAVIREHAERLRLLNEFARSVSGTLDLESVFGLVTGQVPSLVGAARCSVARREPEAGGARLLAVYPRSDDAPGAIPHMAAGDFISRSEGSLGAMSLSGITAVCHDTREAADPTLRHLAANGIHSLASVPLTVGGARWGTLNVGFAEPGRTTPERVEILEAVAAHLGVVIKNAQLYTDVRAAHEELRHTQAQIVQHERLRALGQMASGIAHDFNNALAPVVGFSELLLDHPDELADAENAREYLRLINAGAQDAATVVGRLKEFYRAREDEAQLPVISLPPLVTQVIALTQPRWKDEAQRDGRTIRVETDLQPVPAIAASETELREALTNLIFNAVDAMPSGGTLTLRTRTEDGRRTADAAGIQSPSTFNRPRSAPPAAPATPSTPQVILEVQDTGIGMTEETRKRCLDPFFTSKGERGTGLGLPMVYGIVQRHRGTLQIESTPGQGTTVRICLPAAPEPAAAPVPAPPPVAPPAAPPAPLRVLVVDDDPAARHVAATMLRAEGHTVESAASGREALIHLRAGGFDALLTDRAMPEMSGDQLAAAAKALDPRTPVLLMTGFGELMNAAGERPPAVDVVLGKPLTRRPLTHALASLTSHSHTPVPA